MTKHEKPASSKTIDQRLQRREANRQKVPWKPHELHKFDRGLHPNDKGQNPKK